MSITKRAILASALMMALSGGVHAQAGGGGGAAAGGGNGVGAGGGNSSGAGGMATDAPGATGTGGGMGTGTGAAPNRSSTDQSGRMNNSTRPNTGHGTNDDAAGKTQNSQ